MKEISLLFKITLRNNLKSLSLFLDHIFLRYGNPKEEAKVKLLCYSSKKILLNKIKYEGESQKMSQTAIKCKKKLLYHTNVFLYKKLQLLKYYTKL